ncbi:hypothetical protein [Propionivibrio sp.]|uniref:hypothetical protein n=1 Tax=Propionivibrio sp. TaxID=2212460 RepID=UPI002627AC36|nr:hypothetical protein [Propionivibrio sp.]
MSATIKVFQVGEKRFTHVMSSSHDSVELRNEVNETLLTYGADARVANREGPMGRFYIEYLAGRPCWVYYEMALQTRRVFGPNLIAAEVEVSKCFIDAIGPLDGGNLSEHMPATNGKVDLYSFN